MFFRYHLHHMAPFEILGGGAQFSGTHRFLDADLPALLEIMRVPGGKKALNALWKTEWESMTDEERHATFVEWKQSREMPALEQLAALGAGGASAAAESGEERVGEEEAGGAMIDFADEDSVHPVAPRHVEAFIAEHTKRGGVTQLAERLKL